ncbi:MAG: hypothetical protein JSR34_07375 [Proteobacteria bacterium]|nr:hypothetical protein [Pseudomonadota bacterium]
MNRLFLIASATVLAACCQQVARADTLLVDRARMDASVEHSMRGMGMAAVEHKLGAPAQKLEPRGGQKAQWPLIQRWVYPQYTVYFAHGRVVDVVLNHASPEEIGPAPAH